MSLDSALFIASSGLDVINRRLALVSQNVANAGTPGYAREVAAQSSVDSGGVASGVRLGPATLQLDRQLQGDVLRQNATTSGLQTTQSALLAIDAVLGTPGQGNDLGSLLGGMTDAFSSLAGDPASAAGQQQVVDRAQALAQGINALAQSCQAQRKAAQDSLVSDVTSLNTALGTIGDLTQRIMKLAAAGQSTADLDNQRNAAMQTVSGLIDIQFLPQQDGNLLAVSGGISIPLSGGAGPFAIQPATLGPGAAYPGAAPALTLAGTDVTGAIKGGTIGANLALRDSTLPGFQAGLDEFAHTLATRFDAQGLRLFSDPSGAVPAGGTPVQAGYIGFANTIQVNQAVAADPSLVRDGTQAVAGSPTGASAFTPNPPGGPAGFSGMITRVLDFALGSQIQQGVPQPVPATSGLGVLGTLSLAFKPAGTLSGFATALVSAQSQSSADAQARLGTEQAVQTSLAAKLSASSGVSVDEEMSMMIQLQNAYGANAKIISAAQSMWGDLLNAVRP